jgi:hyperosmotically inducible periplasmic protein
MNRILTSAAIGALAMYFLDPQTGRRRRARTRDKVEHARRRLRNAYDVTARDARHRAQGL